MANTQIVHGIYIHTTAETAHPTLPNSGSSLAQATLNSAGFTTIGSRDQQGHDADLDEDTFAPEMTHVLEDLQPPRGQAPDDSIVLQIFQDEWEFTCYDFSQTLWTLFSTASASSSGVMSWAESNKTARTLILEIRNTGILYFPKVYLLPGAGNMGAASGGFARTVFRVKPLRTSSVTTGVEHQFYQSA